MKIVEIVTYEQKFKLMDRFLCDLNKFFNNLNEFLIKTDKTLKIIEKEPIHLEKVQKRFGLIHLVLIKENMIQKKSRILRYIFQNVVILEYMKKNVNNNNKINQINHINQNRNIIKILIEKKRLISKFIVSINHNLNDVK